jgi:hypothetical protein
MDTAMQAAPPRRPPVSPQKKTASPNKKQRPSLSLMPTTPRSSSVLTISNSNNTCIDGPDGDFGFSDKNALFRSFSNLCLDVGFSDKNALFQSFSDLCLDDFLDEEEEKEPEKQAFMPSLVDFLDDDEFLDDSEFKKMCTEWQASTDAVVGGTKEEVEFKTSLASLFSSFTDLLTSECTFDKKKCSTLQQEMERLKKMRRRVAMSAEYKLGLHKSNDDDDNSGKPRQSGSTGHRETSVERRHRRFKPSESKVNEHSSPVRSSPKWVSPRRSVTPLPGEMSSLMLSPRHPSKQHDPLGASSYHSESPRKRSGLSATLHTTSSRKGDSMSLLDVSSHSMPASFSPRKSSRTPGQSDPIRSLISPRKLRSGASSPVKTLQSPRKSLQKDPLGVSESIRAAQLHGTPRRSTRKGSTGRISAKPEQSPSSVHHFARFHDRSGVPDTPKTALSRSSRGGRSRAQSQTPQTTLSHHLEMFSEGGDLAPTVYYSTEKEDSAPRQPSCGESTAGFRGRRSSRKRQPISRNRVHSVAPDVERESRSSSRGCFANATTSTSLSRRRSKSVAPETGSSRVRSNSVTRDAKQSSGLSHLDLVSRFENRTSRRPSLGSMMYLD